jgi:hypoxanthine phosphoribosyltransferase
MQKIQYTNKQMCGDLLEITRQIAEVSFKPTVILGIARGGLIPATMLSHYYNVPCYTYQYSLRDHSETKTNDEILKIIANHNVLVVDDICDGGHTLAHVAEKLSQYGAYPRFAVLHYNTGQNVFNHVDFYANEINKVENDVWITYEFESWWQNN